jgi:hypothetical protein
VLFVFCVNSCEVYERMFHALRQAARRASSKSNAIILSSISNSSALAAAVVFVAVAYNSRSEKKEDVNSGVPRKSLLNIDIEQQPVFSPFKSLLPTILAPSTCRCELSAKISRLRRNVTSKLMAAEATDKTFFSLYEVDFDHPLGQGAYGDVYLCREIASGEECALKKIPKVRVSYFW